jgi:hypothetical protein
MDRLDLFTPLHKGLRASLFDAVRAVARADFRDDGETRAALAVVRDTLAFLDEQAAHADAVIWPEIAAAGPELGALLRSDRARIAGVERKCAELAARAAEASGVARLALARRLHASLAVLCAELLVHMDRLETQGNRLLWAHRSDEDLRALEARILALIAPERLGAWLALIVPSCCAPERDAILDRLRDGLPLTHFQTATRPLLALAAGGTGR